MKLKQWAVFVLLGTVWGTSFIWIKIALQDIGPFTLVALRLLSGLIGLLVVVRVTHQKFPRDLPTLGKYAILGAINTAVPFTLISWGETRIASALAAILNATTPLFSIVIAHFWLQDDKITLPRIAGLVVGFIGVAVLVSRDVDVQGLTGNAWGQIAVLAASGFYAAGFSFSRRYLRNQPPAIHSTLMLFFAGLYLWIAVPFVEGPLHLPTMWQTWVSVLWLGVLGSCLAYIMLFYLINSWGPTRASVVSYIFPMVGLILGIVILRESPDWRLLVGSGLIVAGIAVLNLRLGRKREPAPANAGAD